ANPNAHYPASGTEAMPVASSGQTLKVKLVPVAYGGDGSNRLPDTSASQVQRYEHMFHAIYPVPAVEITVRASVTWNQDVYANGSGWESLLDAVTSLREQDNTPADVYYMGIFAPASSMDAYCNGACVAGLGSIGGPNDSYARAAIGLGFAGQDAAE